MMRLARRQRHIIARARARIIAASENTAPAEVEPVETVPDPLRRKHMFGSQYRVRMSFDELMATRGYLGKQTLGQRRLVAPGDAQRQRDAATLRAGYVPGEVMWPSD